MGPITTTTWVGGQMIARVELSTMCEYKLISICQVRVSDPLFFSPLSDLKHSPTNIFRGSIYMYIAVEYIEW